MARKVVFLDRDGTLNVDHGYVCRQDDWQWIDGAIDAVRRLKQAGFAIAVVTNQSGIGAGYFTAEDVAALHRFLQEELQRFGAPLDAIAFCPHAADDDCCCRKPDVGMAGQIEATLGEAIDYGKSCMVGDKPSDVQFGQRLAMRTVLLASRYWSAEELRRGPGPLGESEHSQPSSAESPRQVSCSPDLTSDSLIEAVPWIIGSNEPGLPGGNAC